MPVIASIEDLKRLHQRRTPRMFWDYCESGSYTEQTFRENTSQFAQSRLRQRVAALLDHLAGKASAEKSRDHRQAARPQVVAAGADPIGSAAQMAVHRQRVMGLRRLVERQHHLFGDAER